MIGSFAPGKKGKLAEDIWYFGLETKSRMGVKLQRRAQLMLVAMNAAETLDDFRLAVHPPDPRLHRLKGDLKGYYAADIDKLSGWRITFQYKQGRFYDVAIQNYH